MNDSFRWTSLGLHLLEQLLIISRDISPNRVLASLKCSKLIALNNGPNSTIRFFESTPCQPPEFSSVRKDKPSRRMMICDGRRDGPPFPLGNIKPVCHVARPH